MCVVSMIMDHYRERWEPFVPPFTPFNPAYVPSPVQPLTINLEPRITDEEIREFRRLLDRARKYDAEHNEPDCDLEDKKTALKKIAAQLGVDISFVD